jgi:hypothetical protein
MKTFAFIMFLLYGFFFHLCIGYAHTIKGALDICHLDQGHYCYAWACSDKFPDRLITLRLSFDGRSIITPAILADGLRETTVAKECGENAYRGAYFDFDNTIADLLSDGNPHEVTLEALDPETNKYVSLESIVIKGSPAKPFVFFKQPRYQGMVINPASINDIGGLPKGVFGIANWDGISAAIDFGNVTRVCLNSRENKNADLNTPLLRVTPFYVFPEKITPWVMGKKLLVSVSLGVTSAEKWNEGEVYLVMYTLWSNDDGYKFWLGWQLFDLRPMQEFVGLDSCPVCTGWPIVVGHANGGVFGHPAMDSARFTSFSGRPPVKFTIQVTWENYLNALNAIRSMQGLADFPDDALRYRLESVWLNPEICVGAPRAGGILDIQFFDLSIGVQ